MMMIVCDMQANDKDAPKIDGKRSTVRSFFFVFKQRPIGFQ